ncbi:MAG: hypothetical protein ABFS16_09150 [Bacteroidota bacterium]
MNTLVRKIVRLITGIFLLASVGGCGEMLDNPLKDKKTGEDINLLIVDFNFFKTRITCKLVDATDNTVITRPANIYFTGANANDIVTFAGEKKESFQTSQGQLELTIDPNVDISSGSPLNFAVNVEIEGYNTLTKGIQIQTEGKKTFELMLSKKVDESETDLSGELDLNDSTIVISQAFSNLKSGAVDEKEYKIKYSISLNELVKFKDTQDRLIFSSVDEAIEAYQSNPDDFLKMRVSTYDDYLPDVDVIRQNGILKMVLFHKLETGRLIWLNITGKEVGDLNGGKIVSTADYLGETQPQFFGFAEFKNAAWEIHGTTNIYTNIEFSYTLAKASEDDLCETGSKITFSSEMISSFSIYADFFDENNKRFKTTNFKGSFTESFILENVPSRAAKIRFRSNTPSFKPIPYLHIENLCIGSYDINVEKADGYEEYQVVLKAFCPDNPTVAVAPTISGEIKIKNSNDPWQGIEMNGGVANLLAVPDTDYELRFLWENDWETTTFRTEPGNISNQLSNSNVKYGQTEDGRTKIMISHTFEQDICNEMGW